MISKASKRSTSCSETWNRIFFTARSANNLQVIKSPAFKKIPAAFTRSREIAMSSYNYLYVFNILNKLF